MTPSAPRLDLRPLVSADAHAYASWGADPAFCAAAGWTAGRMHAEYLAFHLRLVTDPPPDVLRLAGVQDHEVVAYVDLHGDDPGRRELGYAVGPSSRWGRGLGLVAARAGLGHGFDILGLDEIWAEAVDANVASVRILQRLGMRETGTGDAGTYLGRPTVYRRFALTRTEWEPGHP